MIPPQQNTSAVEDFLEDFVQKADYSLSLRELPPGFPQPSVFGTEAAVPKRHI